MEVFQIIKVTVPDQLAVTFKDKVIQQAQSIGWKNFPDFEKDYIKNTMSDSKVICIQTDKLFYNNKELAAYVWMRGEKGIFEVFNIIPINIRQLNYGQYNFILDQFYKRVVAVITRELALDSIISSPNKSMHEMIGEDSYRLLYRFSHSANKSTGNTNPHDFERWCDFVLAIFRNKVELNADDLVRWLEEDEGWSDTIAWKLGLDFEYGLQLLDRYEQSK